MRVLLADSNHAVLHETLIKAGFDCDLFWDKPANELVELLPAYEALVIRSKFKLDAPLLEKCTRLKCIGRVGAGMENIDQAFAKSKGIVCLSVPEGNRDAVGEHAIGMLLMLLNNLKKADEEVRNGKWIRSENRGTEIMGKTVGIIGYGNTGKALASKLSGFGCKILAYDKYLKGYSDQFAQESSLERLYEECDIVSLHLPLTAETKYFANQEFFRAFKKNIYFINTARGSCLNTAELIPFLDSGKVKGACLDVLEFESLSFENNTAMESEVFRYLIQSTKVVLSPHIAGWTHESNYKMSRFLAEKMIAELKR
ncbi:MAG: hydroxyacid dehydrogenase [Bacteroidia bacterium]|nr:hydroxyacid dehydrogenase [Bacteroidia bacterium]